MKYYIALCLVINRSDNYGHYVISQTQDLEHGSEALGRNPLTLGVKSKCRIEQSNK